MLTKIPNGYSEIVKTFGDPSSKDFEARNIISVTLPYSLLYEHNSIHTIRCHKLAADNFIAVFKALFDAKLSHIVKEYNGIYNHRPIRGRTKDLSVHAFGAAIDLEASNYPLGSNKRFPDSVIECFKKFGFFYGGDFKSRKDPMHFQLATGY